MTTGTLEDRPMISRSKVSDVTSMTWGEDEDDAGVSLIFR
jgi:hypothetical protein